MDVISERIKEESADTKPPTKGQIMPVFTLFDQGIGLVKYSLSSCDPFNPWEGARELDEATQKIEEALELIKRAMSKLSDQ